MSTHIVRFRNYQEPAYAEKALAIRFEVFVSGLQVDPTLEYEHEDEAHHYLLFHENKPVATARWRETENGIKLERFATLDGYRSMGFGSQLLQEILADVKGMSKKIYLHAQLGAVRFYEKHGFVKEGGIFYEANIGHYMMIFA